MSNVAILHKCGCCGKAVGKPFDLALHDEVVGNGFACDDCMEQSMALLDQVRPVFAKMVEVGVPEDIASDTMTFLLQRMSP